MPCLSSARRPGLTWSTGHPWWARRRRMLEGPVGACPTAPARPGAEEGLSSSHGNLLVVPRPLRRRVLRHPLQDPWCLPWPSPSQVRARLPLGPLARLVLTTLQASRDVADRPVASAPLRRQPLDRRRGPRYRGPWRLPGPDFHRLATVSLSFGYVRSWLHLHVPAPELLDAHLRKRRARRDSNPRPSD